MLRTKKSISVILLFTLIFSLLAGTFSSVNAKGKTLYANKTKITIQDKGTVTITSKSSGSLSFKVANKNICSAKWGKWKGDNIKLYLSGKSYGSTKITVKNTKTKKSIKITVNVRTVDIKLPKTPFYINSYDYDGYLTDTVKITKVWTKIKYWSFAINDPSVQIYVKGVKTYSDQYADISDRVWVPWKVYKGNTVVDSGSIITSDISVGEGFVNYTYIDNVKPGKYNIKFLNHIY